jgi:hypothetical protein
MTHDFSKKELGMMKSSSVGMNLSFKQGTSTRYQILRIV